MRIDEVPHYHWLPCIIVGNETDKHDETSIYIILYDDL